MNRHQYGWIPEHNVDSKKPVTKTNKQTKNRKKNQLWFHFYNILNTQNKTIYFQVHMGVVKSLGELSKWQVQILNGAKFWR